MVLRWCIWYKWSK